MPVMKGKDRALIITKRFKRQINTRGSKMFKQGYCYEYAKFLQRNLPRSKIYFVKNRHHYVLKHKGNYYDVDGMVKITDKDKLILDRD